MNTVFMSVFSWLEVFGGTTVFADKTRVFGGETTVFGGKTSVFGDKIGVCVGESLMKIIFSVFVSVCEKSPEPDISFSVNFSMISAFSTFSVFL